MQPHSSKAWRSIKYLASVFTAVLCHAGAIQVDPISTRRLAIDVHETRTANRLSRFPLNRHEHQRLAALLLEQRFVRPSFEILGCPHGVGNPAKDIVNGVLRHFPKRFPVLAVGRFLRFVASLIVGSACGLGVEAVNRPHPNQPTFYRDILPILERHCQSCHRPGEIGPMPLVTYQDVRPWAAGIRDAIRSKSMPPWFADPCCGHFADDPSLTAEQISTIASWADSNAPPGDPKDAPPSPLWTEGWNISQPDSVIRMPKSVAIPPSGDVEYTYEIVPTNFSEDMWVQMSEVRPSSRANVHHAVVYIRPPESDWLRGAPIGVPFTPSSLGNEKLRHEAHETKSDMLLVYAPGSSPDHWHDGMAKFVPAHSDLVFQMHYTTNGTAADDQSSIGLVFARHAPAQRVITLQLANDHED